MKLSLLGTAGCLDRAAGGPWPLVGTAFFLPIAFVKWFINKNAYGPPIAVGSIISLFLIAGPAAADPYKWCAAYRNGSNNCGFTTIEQCRASVSGVGGSCVPNQFYTGPDKTSAQRSPKQVQRKPPAEHRAQERRTTETPAQERRVPEDRFQ
ncbi:MAG: DUF3551 domain-containing protein [Pseudolabrys sp.]